MNPDAIIVRAERLKKNAWVRPLDRLSGGGTLASDPQKLNGGHHVVLNYVDGSHFSVHASVLFIVLVESEEA